MLNVLVVEDEEYTLKFLEKLVSDHPMVDNVKATSNSYEAISLAKNYLPHVAFLDIELAATDQLNGIDVAKAIANLSPHTKFVFVTGYSKYAIDSFAVHPFDYILKPIKIEKVVNTITALAADIDQKPKNKQKRFVVKTATGISFINPDSILFLEKQGKKAILHTTSNVYEITCKFNDLEHELSDHFLRVHRSFIVNIDKISKIKDAGNQSYLVYFENYQSTALMSRNKYREHQDRFTPSF